MRSKPIYAYVYINGEIIQSSSANAVFRGDKTKSLLLNPIMTLPSIITATQSSIIDNDVMPIINALGIVVLYMNSMVKFNIGQFKLMTKKVFCACFIHL